MAGRAHFVLAGVCTLVAIQEFARLCKISDARAKLLTYMRLFNNKASGDEPPPPPPPPPPPLPVVTEADLLQPVPTVAMSLTHQSNAERMKSYATRHSKQFRSVRMKMQVPRHLRAHLLKAGWEAREEYKE